MDAARPPEALLAADGAPGPGGGAGPPLLLAPGEVARDARGRAARAAEVANCARLPAGAGYGDALVEGGWTMV